MKHLARVAACGLVLLVALSPAGLAQKVRGVGGDDPAGATPTSGDAVLIIDGDEVPAEAYAHWLIAEVGPPLIEDFAGGWAVEREGRRRGLEVGAQDVRGALEEEIGVRVENAFLGRKEDWLAELRRLGRSEGGHRSQRTSELETLLWTTALADDGRVVPEEKVVRDWELFHGPRGRAFELSMMKFQVVVQMPANFAGREDYERARENARSAGLERALAARARLEAGGDFAELARALSDDEDTREDGGHVERFSQFGWPTGFVDALFELAPGQVSEPLFARGGWWLVRVEGFHDTPLESVRAELTRRLVERGPEQDEIGAAWNAVTRDLDIEVSPELYAPAGSSDAESPSAVAMHVEGEPISRAEYALWLLHRRGEASWQQFTEEWLVRREAAKLGLEVTAEEAEARTREYVERLVAEGYKGDRTTWLAYLNSTGRDESTFIRQLRRRQAVSLLVEKLILAEREVTPADVRRRYEELYGETGRRVQARVVLLEIPTPELEPGLSREEVQARLDAAAEARRQDALEVVRRLEAGEDFASLVRQLSDDRISRERDGRLEGGFRPDGWSSDVSEVVMALDVGAVSPPLLESRYWAVFEVTAIEPVPFESVEGELREELESRRPGPPEVSAYRNVLLKQAEVEVLPGMYR